MRNLRLLIFICFLSVLAPFSVSAAPQAGLFLNPAAGSFLVGSTFDLSIILDTKGTAINTIEIELLFPPDKVQVSSPSVGRSIIQLWPAPPVFSNREGRIYFIGGIPSPGITTSQGIVLTLTFRVIGPGEGQIKFGEKTRILANDGRGTNILGQMPPAFFKFLVPPPQGPSVSSPTHPDQERWYRDTNPVFVWSKTQFTSAYSYSIDRDPSGFPDTTTEGTSPTASFQNLENGIWYFHLRESAGGVWGGVSHYVLKIDSQPPASFRINVSPALRTTNPDPVFRFFTTDSLSGFDHFEMKIILLSSSETSEALFFEVTSPYQAVNLDKGRYQIIIRALDTAGNSRDEAVTLNIVSSLFQFITPEGMDIVFVFLPWSWMLLIVSILLFIFLVMIFILWKKHKHHLKHAFREDILRLLHLIGKRLPKITGLFLVLIPAIFIFGSKPNIASSISAKNIAPVISVSPQKYYPLDEFLYLEGKAAPNTEVEILLERVSGGASPVRTTVQVNSNGEWFFSERLELASGEWMARARVLSESPSDWSNPRIINSIVSGIIWGGLKIRYLPIFLGILALFLAGAAFFIYSLLRARTIQRTELEREMVEKTKALEQRLQEQERQATEILIEQNFTNLRKSILEEIECLDKKVRERGRLSKEEEGHRENLLRQLRIAEEAIEKNLRESTS